MARVVRLDRATAENDTSALSPAGEVVPEPGGRGCPGPAVDTGGPVQPVVHG